MSGVSADYLVVGAGAMGMAFTDVILTETDKSVVIVDRHHRPGGHWNDAYPFVRLHQPSAFYGVNSRHLGNDTIDQHGWNAGLFELATNSEVCAYFDQVMREQFLPSGRVQYFPMSEVNGDDSFTSLVTGAEQQVTTEKVVDATYMNVTVPSMRKPPYEVEQGVRCVPLNELPRVDHPKDGYVIIGAGKTGMDACLWLLSNGVDPDHISWVMPRDSLMLDRAQIQPGALAENAASGQFAQLQVVAQSESVEELFNNVVKAGALLQFDDEVAPTMYRCATVTTMELEQLRRIRNIIRMGRVKRVEASRLVLDDGELELTGNKLFVDCSADGLERRPIVPVFNGRKITLQAVRTCQQVFSAGFIGHVEASYADDEQKNELAQPVPHPDSHIDYLKTMLGNMNNAARWAQDAQLTQWLKRSRLDGFSREGVDSPPPSEAVLALTETALLKLQKYIAEAEGG